MKSEKVLLCRWRCEGWEEELNNDIPWPLIHEKTGNEIIRWINNQDHVNCQLILEKNTSFAMNTNSLFVEFYNPKLRTEFAIRFAK